MTGKRPREAGQDAGSRQGPTDPRLELQLRELELAFDRRSWHGPNLMGALRGIKPAGACWRPQPERHNVAEIVVHCGYWKYRVCRLLDQERHPEFSIPGSDWFPREGERSPADQRRDTALLKEWHARLLDEVRRLAPARLDRPSGADRFTVSELISGIAAHDLYHAGQIRLIRRMCGAGQG